MSNEDTMQQDFLSLRFGMFLHYNMATYSGMQWVSGYADPSVFDPGGAVDTDAWADAAVSAGMQYGVLTAKHVGGFCLWDSEYTDYSIAHPDCRYEDDLVARFVQSFTSRGLKAGLYYSWRNPGFDDDAEERNVRQMQQTGERGTWEFKVLPPECDPSNHSREEQIEFQKLQIAELMQQYPDVFYIWNDGLDPRIMPASAWQEYAKGIRPDVIQSANWWDWSKKGTPYADLAVTEQRHFPENNEYPGETCWCLEDDWFWSEGTRTKNPANIAADVRTANSRNANFLLNVGPDKRGRFMDTSTAALTEIGKLLAGNR